MDHIISPAGLHARHTHNIGCVPTCCMGACRVGPPRRIICIAAWQSQGRRWTVGCSTLTIMVVAQGCASNMYVVTQGVTVFRRYLPRYCPAQTTTDAAVRLTPRGPCRAGSPIRATAVWQTMGSGAAHARHARRDSGMPAGLLLMPGTLRHHCCGWRGGAVSLHSPYSRRPRHALAMVVGTWVRHHHCWCWRHVCLAQSSADIAAHVCRESP